jgi:hypothetical protein
MASDDKKTKADPVQKNEAPPKTKSTSDAKSTPRMQPHPRPRVGRKMPAHLPAIIEARARSR